MPAGLYYKIIYKVGPTSQLYLVNFYNDFLTGQNSVLSVDQYTSEIEQGDYRWKCTSSNANTGVCFACESSDYLLTAGRCYSKLNGCTLQMASTCFVCQAGYLRNGRICDK